MDAWVNDVYLKLSPLLKEQMHVKFVLGQEEVLPFPDIPVP